MKTKAGEEPDYGQTCVEYLQLLIDEAKRTR
jgi:hypothetical protein